MNLYEYVSSNPLFWLDPFGRFEIEWEGSWSQSQKDPVMKAMAAVKERLNVLIEEINASIVDMMKCRKCYKGLIKKSSKVRALFQGMKDDIDSTGLNLEIYKVRLNDDVLAVAIIPYFFRDFELHLSVHPENNFFYATDSKQMLTIFHELSHFRGTEDETEDWSNNAHRLDNLALGGSWNNFPDYRLAKIKADERRKAGKCCCPKKSK